MMMLLLVVSSMLDLHGIALGSAWANVRSFAWHGVAGVGGASGGGGGGGGGHIVYTINGEVI